MKTITLLFLLLALLCLALPVLAKQAPTVPALSGFSDFLMAHAVDFNQRVKDCESRGGEWCSSGASANGFCIGGK